MVRVVHEAVSDDERDEGYDESNNNVFGVCVGSVAKDCIGVCGCRVLNHCVDIGCFWLKLSLSIWWQCRFNHCAGICGGSA